MARRASLGQELTHLAQPLLLPEKARKVTGDLGDEWWCVICVVGTQMNQDAVLKGNLRYVWSHPHGIMSIIISTALWLRVCSLC